MAASTPKSNFTLLPAIFTPFEYKVSPSNDAEPALRPSSTEKLRAILVKLDTHHDAVRRNMMYLIGVEKDRIIEDAMAKRKAQQERGELENDDPLESRIAEKSIAELLERLKAPFPEGTDARAYEIKDDERPFLPPLPQPQPQIDADSNAAMVGAGTAATHSSSGNPRSEMAHEIQKLLVRAANEIRAYDVHASQVRKKYEDALERQLKRENGILSGAATPAAVVSGSGPAAFGPAGVGGGSRRGSGILVNRNEQIRVDMDALARMDLDVV